jgi:dolichol-phosphate mannosyltransferase
MSGSLVLLPTYNERENLPRVLRRLLALRDVDVLVIDDASPDGTGELAEAMRRRYDCLSVLHRIEKDGLGRAYVSGMKEALRRGYSRIVTMDADLSHSPEDVPRLLQALESADVALGSRHVPGGGVRNWPLSRQLLSQAGSLYARILLRLPLRDVTSGFRAYRAEALSAIDLEALRAKGFSFQIEILRRLLDLPGARAQELPIEFRDRAAGVSKLSGGIIAEALLEVLRLSFAEPALVFKEIRSESELPRVTIVVPTREAEAEPEALDALERLDYPRERFEVLVVRGNAPAAERNLAARESQPWRALGAGPLGLALPRPRRVALGRRARAHPL